MHHAYAFSPSSFQRRIAKCQSSNGEIDERILHGMAATALAASSSTMQQALEAMRFDPLWMDDFDTESSHVADWCAILLAEELIPVASLSDGTPPAFAVLRQALSATGWSTKDLNALIMGDALESLFSAPQNNLVPNAFVGIGQRGGWLSRVRIQQLLELLTGTRHSFSIPSAAVVASLQGVSGTNIAANLMDAYDAAYKMLQYPIERNFALMLILD